MSNEFSFSHKWSEYYGWKSEKKLLITPCTWSFAKCMLWLDKNLKAWLKVRFWPWLSSNSFWNLKRKAAKFPDHGGDMDIINYSSALKREIWMHSRLEKPIIREERAETSSAAFIKFGFSIARGKNWETQERVFEEEGLILNLSLKRGSLRTYKDYSWAFENDEKTDIFSMKDDFKSDFSKTQTSF